MVVPRGLFECSKIGRVDTLTQVVSASSQDCCHGRGGRFLGRLSWGRGNEGEGGRRRAVGMDKNWP